MGTGDESGNFKRSYPKANDEWTTSKARFRRPEGPGQFSVSGGPTIAVNRKRDLRLNRISENCRPILEPERTPQMAVPLSIIKQRNSNNGVSAQIIRLNFS